MARRLLDAGYPLTVYNRTLARTQSLAAAGARVVDKPAAAIREAQLVISMLADYAATCEVLFSEDKQDFKGKTLIQMGTILPSESLLIKEWFGKSGGEYVEAPVLGSIPQANSGTLFVLVGGTPGQQKRWDPVLAHFGKERIFFGETGRAAAAKLALNQLIATLTSAFSMSLGYLLEKNVDLDKFLGILRQSALFAPTFDKKLDKMLKRDFANPNFPLKHLLKDVNLIHSDFSDAGLHTGILDGVRDILEKGMEGGDGESDYSSLYNSVHPKNKE